MIFLYLAMIAVLFSLAFLLAHIPSSKRYKLYYENEKKRIAESYAMGEYLD